MWKMTYILYDLNLKKSVFYIIYLRITKTMLFIMCAVRVNIIVLKSAHHIILNVL
jgi:hypothetical protein